MLSISEYCDRVKRDAYGGSIELVEDGILAIKSEIESGSFENSGDVAKKVEECVEDVLGVATSVLPLINLLIRCMQCSEKHTGSREKAETAKNAFLSLLQEVKLAQDTATNRIGDIGANMIKDGFKVGTFSTSGSVMAIFKKAIAQGKSLSAICFEARPRSEGFRTFREVSELGIPTRFGVDALLCVLIPKTDYFVIGADAVRNTGEVFAKTGSYLAALACKEFGVPFYVAADTSKYDSLSRYGYPLKDSSRPKIEAYPFEIPKGSDVVNISFELIPPSLISGLITEKGLIPATAIGDAVNMGDISPRIVKKLGDWVQSSRRI